MAAKRTESLALQGSRKARQIAAAVLEALSGALSTGEAAARLSISLSRYYQLEARALQGLLEAVEPRGKGPRQSAEKQKRELEARAQRLEKELRRHQALLRAAQRGIGLPPRGAKTQSGRGRGKKRRGSRGETVLQTLRRDDDAPGGSDESTQRAGMSAGRPAGQRRSEAEAGDPGGDAPGTDPRGTGV